MSAGLDAFVPGKVRFVGAAFVRGRLYSVGGEYPALVTGKSDADESRFGGSQPVVHGELWAITDELARPVIDDFEGIGPGYAPPQLYRREPVEAFPDHGPPLTAQAYVYNLSTTDLSPVLSGDWARP